MPRDLYAGEPLILAARFTELPRSVAVSGLAGSVPQGAHGAGASRSTSVPLPGSGLHVLWARNRIETLSDAIRQARHTATPQDELREQLVKLALDHHLVSAYTSLVAVDLHSRAPGQHADAPRRGSGQPAGRLGLRALTGAGAGQRHLLPHTWARPWPGPRHPRPCSC